jgi:hypothetical protein
METKMRCTSLAEGRCLGSLAQHRCMTTKKTGGKPAEHGGRGSGMSGVSPFSMRDERMDGLTL